MSANRNQEGGSHYKTKPIQPWDFIAQNGIGYLEGNAIKYLARWRDKNGVEDLRKARHYIDKLIELETQENPPITAYDGPTHTVPYHIPAAPEEPARPYIFAETDPEPSLFLANSDAGA